MSAVHDAALTGQVAVVTGGGRGIGAAIAEKLAAMDAAIVICGRSRDMVTQAPQSFASEVILRPTLKP